MKVKEKAVADEPASQNKPSLALDYYKEICNNIRVTDDISFKLLNIVPVLSGIGATALVYIEKNNVSSGYLSLAVIGFSICGALITLGLFKWELRNIQKCNWLIERAGDFERGLLQGTPQTSKIQFADFNDEIKNLKISRVFKKTWRETFEMSWGKTESEKLIYSTAIAVWLIPVVVVILQNAEAIGTFFRGFFNRA